VDGARVGGGGAGACGAGVFRRLGGGRDFRIFRARLQTVVVITFNLIEDHCGKKGLQLEKKRRMIALPEDRIMADRQQFSAPKARSRIGETIAIVQGYSGFRGRASRAANQLWHSATLPRA